MRRIIWGTVFFTALAVAVFMWAPGLGPAELKAMINDSGATGPLIFIVLCALKPILFFLPSLGLTVIAGTVFGPFYGTIYVAIGGAGSTAVAFYFARFFGRGSVEKLISGRKTLVEIDEKMATDGFKTVFMLRLFNIPWDLVSYSAGISAIGFKEFYLSSLILLIPSSFIFTYFGSKIGDPLSPGFILALFLIVAMGSVPFIVKRVRRWQKTGE
ncbi:MAG: TVP38/TMEM64 family protein [Deltaproteobacteria bacterium]